MTLSLLQTTDVLHLAHSVTMMLLIAGLSFMAEFLENLPSTKAKRVARRSQGAEAAFVIYGWGLPVARGAAQTIKVHPTLQQVPAHPETASRA